MSDAIVKALLESLTDEQKADLISGLQEQLGIKPLKKTVIDPEIPTVDVTVELQREEITELGRKKPAPVVNEDFTVTRPENDVAGKRPVRAAGENQFVDDGVDGRGEETELTPEQIKKMEATMTARQRSAPKIVERKCHICGRDFKINENLIYGERVRCNRCTG